MPANGRDINPLDNSSPIDWMRVCNLEGFQRFVEHIYNDINSCESTRTVTDRPSDKAKKLLALEAVILDMFVSYSHDPERYVAISLGSNNYTNLNVFFHEGVTRTCVKFSLDGLKALGYMDYEEGTRDNEEDGQSRLTRIRVKSSFYNTIKEAVTDNDGHIKIELRPSPCCVWLKEIKRSKNHKPKRVPILPQLESDVIAMHNNLKVINDYHKGIRINLCITDTELRALEERVTENNRRENPSYPPFRVDFNKKQLVRIFNNLSIELGGRFYHGWWQALSEEDRVHITLNGEPTIEIDYRAMGLHMLYVMAGQHNSYNMEDDPYDICLEDYDQSTFSSRITRSDIKKDLNALVNMSSEDRIGRRRSIVKDLVLSKHPLIENYLCTGKGRETQYHDSKIAEQVMLKMIHQGIPCLPIHDSFIVPQTKRDDLVNAMATSYKDVMNVDIAPDKHFSIEESETVELPVNDDNQEEYTGYLSRETYGC